MNGAYTEETNRKAARLLGKVQSEFLDEWHWFGYHAHHLTPFIISVACACAELDRINPDAPEQMLRELAAIRGREKDKAQYHQLLQKMAEILVMQQVVRMAWPDGTRFEIEGGAVGSNKRVDLVVIQPDGIRFGFEVKSPDELKHAEQRARGGFQFPVRSANESANSLRDGGDNVILPRDNTIRDFLRSADEKFEGFKAAGSFIGILVIVWDDYIYEAIGPLVNEKNGLLRALSYSRDGDGPERFSYVDGVFLLRHIAYFTAASVDQELPDGRQNGMHVGGEGALPSVYVPVPGGQLVPDFITGGLNALKSDHPDLQNVAEYQSNEIVLWVPF